MKIFLFILIGGFAAVSSGPGKVPFRNLYADPETGKGYLKDEYLESRRGDSRIYYGRYAEINEFPWVVDLEFKGEKNSEDEYPLTETSWQCVGTIIDEEWIITAGHCLANSVFVNITFAETDKCSENEHRFYIYMNDTSRFHYHPEFNLTELLNDIALIELPYPVELDGTYVDRAYLPDSKGELYSIGDEAEVVGWGSDDFNSGTVCWLQKKLVKVLPLEDCIAHNQDTVSFNGGSLCTTDAVCKGDTGGPLNSYTTAAQTIYGVVSYYMMSTCNYYPVGYAWVRYYLDWIHDVSGVMPPPGNCPYDRNFLTKFAKKAQSYK